MPPIIWFRPRALRELHGLPKVVQTRIIKRLEALAADPSAVRLERLKGPWRSFSKLRIGDYRVVLRVETDRLHVASLGHRSDVYEDLARIDPGLDC